MTIASKIILRKDTAANWASANPVLAAGEPAWVTDSKLFAIGDGISAFATLTKFKNASQVDAAVSAAVAAQDAAEAAAALVDAALDGLTPTVLAPPGALVMFPATAAPAGYLKANGATGLLRADFPNLWAFIQSSGLLAASEGVKQPHQFGPGNGSTTFSLIDARGYALRAWDDGRGVDAGRGIGTYQADQVKDHTHGAAVTAGGAHVHTVSDPGHTHGINDPGHAHAFVETGGNGGYGSGESYDPGTGQLRSFNRTTVAAATGIWLSNALSAIGINVGGAHSHPISIYGINSGGAGAETRMKNVAYLLCIKY